MTDVLIVAYHYPPIASGGTERAVSLVRHLPDFGYRPHVLTTDAFGTEADGPVYRAGEPVGWYRRLFNRQAIDLPAHRRSLERTRSSVSSLASLARSVMIPDGQLGWLPAAYRAARHIVDTQNVKLVLTTGPPFSAHLLGLILHRFRQLPWVADFRDTWTYDPLDPALSADGARRRLETKLERLVLNEATHATCATEVAAFDLRSRSGDTAVSVVPNGYTQSEKDAATKAGDGVFRFVHTGSFSASHPLRDPAALAEAAERLRREGASFELVLVGQLTEYEKGLFSSLAESGHAVLTGALTRDEALAWQTRADVLVVVDHPRDVLASNVPGKVYEYGAAGKKMLAIVPPGATRSLVEESGTGICVGHDADDIADAMRRLVSGDETASGDSVWWRRFERRASVKLMASVMDRVTL